MGLVSSRTRRWQPSRFEPWAGANVRKHGIRFAGAVTALEDGSAISIRDEGADEERWITIGMDSVARTLVVVYSWRGEKNGQARRPVPPAAGDSEGEPAIQGRL